MPRYVVRLEDPDSDEFRETTLVRDSEADAVEWCEERERRSVAFQVGPDELKDLKARRKADKASADDAPVLLAGRDKARLLTHEQAKPYVVKSITESPKGGG